MHLRHVVPFLALFAWQTSVEPPDTTGIARVRAWLGAGASGFQLRFWDWVDDPITCCGNPPCGTTRVREVVRRRRTEMRAGARVDAWPARQVRISAAAAIGGSADRVGGGRVLAALELPLLGAGAGASLDAADGEGRAAAYARIGPLDGVHVRADLRHPSVAPGVMGFARAGLALNQGRRLGTGFFVGMADVRIAADTTYPAPPTTLVTRVRRMPFLEVTHTARNLGFFLQAHAAGDAWGVAAGVIGRLVP